ncbi:hypothetical protein SAMN05421803_10446 [Nocardiopsis flavescens]|uniref:HNH endonuclease n=1 Tax=Nocardiopsis flavescens TaxID=758803 RepID=A0A1M6H5X5_9ACTN|nr:hypothetical protein [Nocardiopsis flavescens]SHJ17566.1 hypothetical protein SAMN05421803_10446 [Nocardiopsis flavescens]
MGERDITEVYVYVGEKGTANLRRGIERSVWGWKLDTVEDKKAHHEVLTSLKKDDRLYLGHEGLGRISRPEAQTRTVPEVVVARLTGGLYQHGTPVWDDDVYPYRVPLVIEETLHDVTKEHPRVGPEGIEALRRSACAQGGPYLPESRESVMEQALKEALQEHGGEKALLDPEDPADQIMRDLPPVLDISAYVHVRAEQKKLRAKKLKGRTEVPCDLCGQVLPKRLVHTAHIKRRSKSDHQERSDLSNVMFACTLGCDSLFEHGFVYVDAGGRIRPSSKAQGGALSTAAQRLGEHCLAFSTKNADYFAWHRRTIAAVEES